ncbi:MAG: hypothetical protein JNM56_29000 [Planctomycetia bacterium]|nr:hypothetical protein [Planctomycetia bacterium]
MDRHYKPDSGWERNQAEQRTALLALRQAHEALDQVLTDHGAGCDCELCHEAAGMTYVLWLFCTTLESLAPADVVLPRSELLQEIRAVQAEAGWLRESKPDDEPDFDETRCWRCQQVFPDPDKEHAACPQCTKKRLVEYQRHKAKERPTTNAVN